MVNKEVGRVYVDGWMMDGFERRTWDVFDSRIEVDATDAIHFISSLRHVQVLTLMAVEFSGNISLTLTFRATQGQQTNLSHLSIPSQHRMQTAHRLY